MKITLTSPPAAEGCPFAAQTTDVIATYFKNFDTLAESEKWEEIISLGTVALETAQTAKRARDEAIICAQLTSTTYYKGDYTQASFYATRCHELSEQFEDPSLFIRALFLESAVNRAFAGKDKDIEKQQAYYRRAVEICEEAALIYSNNNFNNLNLWGKIHFNLGAAHADNQQGDLTKAVNSYLIALTAFKSVDTADDIIRTHIRLAGVYLRQKNCDLCQQVLNEVRPQISTERIAMHADYLEARLKIAQNDIENAIRIAKNGLARAKALGAKEDEQRLATLLQAMGVLS